MQRLQFIYLPYKPSQLYKKKRLELSSIVPISANSSLYNQPFFLSHPVILTIEYVVLIPTDPARSFDPVHKGRVAYLSIFYITDMELNLKMSA